MELFRSALRQECGIGLRFEDAIVRGIVQNGPCDGSGVVPGDRLIAIDDQPILQNCVDKNLVCGKEDSKITLTFLTLESEKRYSVSVVRKPVSAGQVVPIYSKICQRCSYAVLCALSWWRRLEKNGLMEQQKHNRWKIRECKRTELQQKKNPFGASAIVQGEQVAYNLQYTYVATPVSHGDLLQGLVAGVHLAVTGQRRENTKESLGKLFPEAQVENFECCSWQCATACKDWLTRRCETELTGRAPNRTALVSTPASPPQFHNEQQQQPPASNIRSSNSIVFSPQPARKQIAFKDEMYVM